LEANVAISSVILIKDFICSPELSALALGPSGLVPLSLEMLYFRCLLFYHFRSIMRSPFIPSFLSAVFNLGRHIPAASHCTPKQCYSLIVVHEVTVSGINGLPPVLGSILTREVVSSNRSALHIEFFQSANQAIPTFVPHFEAV
jgi:hypothetical protein